MKSLIQQRSFLFVLLVLSAWIVYGRSITFDFLLLDDNRNVFENPYFQTLGFASLLEFWKSPYYGMFIPITYNVWGSLAILAGGFNPAVFHAANVLFHSMNGVLVFLLIEKWLSQIRTHEIQLKSQSPKIQSVALLGGLIFVLHPVQVETVAWVTGLRDLISTFFTLLSLFLFSSRDSKSLWGFSILFFILALLSKPSVLFLPLVIFLLSRYGESQSGRRSLILAAPYLLIAIGFSVITIAQQDLSAMKFQAPWWSRPFLAAEGLLFYTEQLLWPVNLSPDYGRTPEKILKDSRIYWAWLVFAVSASSSIYLSRKRPEVRREFLFDVITVLSLLPVLGLIPFRFQEISMVADHYLYLPLAFIAASLSALILRIPIQVGKVIAVLIMTLAVLSFRQLPYWKNSVTLSEYVLGLNPESFTFHSLLGDYYIHRKNHQKSFEHYKRALEIAPDLKDQKYNYAVSMYVLGRQTEAIEYLLKLHRNEPLPLIAQENLGKMLYENKRHREAIPFLEAVLRVNPTKAELQRILVECHQLGG